MKRLIFAIVATSLVGPAWAQEKKPELEPQPMVTFRAGCEWSVCAQKLNGCKPLRGNVGTTERYDAIARRVDACNRGRESCECPEAR